MRYLLLLTVLFSATLHATSIQKWVDDEGNVHYGDAPPTNTVSESVRVQRAPSNPGRALPRLNTTPSADESENAEEAANAEQKEQMQLNCELARKNMSTLTGGGRIKVNQGEGESRYLNDEEIAERTLQTEKDIEFYCQ